jgi:putative ATP-binding cassette transporter
MRLISDYSRAISFLVQYAKGIRRVRLLVILVIAAGIISGLCNTALIAVITAALSRGPISAGNLVWAFIGLSLVFPITRFISSTLLAYLSTRATFTICTQLSRQVLAAPLRRLEEIGPHRLLASLGGDVGTLSNVLPVLPTIVVNMAVVLGCLAYLAWLSPILLLGLLLFMVVGVITYQIPLNKGAILFRLSRKHGDSLYGCLRALVEGTKELKLHQSRGEAFHARMLTPAAGAMATLNYKGSLMQGIAQNWGVLLSFIPLGLLVFLVPRLGTFGSEVLIGYTLTILYMVGPLQAIINMLPTLTVAGVAAEKIYSLGLPALANGSEAAAITRSVQPWRELSLNGVTHTYYREKEESNFTLGPINLAIHPGELIFLIGGNGSGKTTLAKMLCGLYAPESGQISLDGETITEANNDYYRKHFTMLFSDFFLFDSLLGFDASNLDARAKSYLTMLHLDRKVQVDNGKLSTVDLSQGQRKRLALLNAYLEDRPIYIFDEWASDQDPVFREVFYYQLLSELKSRGKTIIVISHDDRYYGIGDRIIKLDYGTLVYDQPVGSARTAIGNAVPQAS